MTAPSAAHKSTRFLGRYELMYLLGQGGMGEVHLARLTGAAGFEKLCIVKTILPQMMSDPQFVDRFHHEAKVLVQLNHSNIAQVYDMGDVDSTLYMAIEYVPGVDLARVVDRARASDSAIPVPVALLIGQQMCEALGYAHRKVGADGAPLGLVHRDVSPQNVMVSYEGEVKVIDFGLAKSSARSKHTLPSTVLGKLGYMSPEQARAEKVDHRSDIYSAGIVVWELLAGRPFINGGTVGEMVAMMANPKVPPLRELRPEVSEAVERLVVRALQPDPSGRYSRADDFARAINEQLVRESLVVGSEDVGNYVRAMCPEEFAAERQLQSRLSSLGRKKGTSSNNVNAPAAAPVPMEGTFLRAPASSIAAGVIAPTQVRTPLPPGSGSSPAPMTAAQRAMSSVFVEEVNAQGATDPSPAYAPGAQVGQGRSNPGFSGLSSGQLSAEYQVPRSKGPMMVVLLLALVALAGSGYFGWKQFFDKPVEPLVVEPPPPKTDDGPAAVAKAEPPEKTEPEKTQPEKAEPAAKLERIEVKGPVWKIIRDGDRYYVQVAGKPRQLEKGDEVKVLGPEVEKGKRDVYGVGSVVETDRSLARILVDEDTVVPSKAFAIKETGPGRVARAQKKAAAEAARVEPQKSEPQKGTEVARVEPAKTEPAKTEPQKVEVAKAEPQKNEPARVEPVKTEQPLARPEPARVEKVEAVRPAAGPQKQLSGAVVVGKSQAKVHVFNRSDFDWHACELWTPTHKYFRFEGNDGIASGESEGVAMSRLTDFTKPDYPKEFGAGWALMRCREGAGWLQFKGN
ncbi:MAG: protein kinase [Archangiaceae bacterium]|nr:protein kinase [Archangiaceae bacterium]